MSGPSSSDHHRGRVPRGVALVAAATFAAACGRGSSTPSALPPTSPVSGSPSATSPSPTTSATELAAPKPPIVWKPIPFPDSRKEEMRAYAQEHYGLDTFELIHPQVIVEHFTA